MNKYLQVFKISLRQEFVYRINFILWRFRNILQIILIFFLWTSVFSDAKRVVFDYNKAKILTYIFGIFVIKAIVTSARSVDIAGEVSRGDLSNFLLKPISYIKYWIVRDFSSKTLNFVFSVSEIVILFVILKPDIFLQNNLFYVLAFVLLVISAIFLFFLLLFLFSLFPLWHPEQAWGASFLLFIFTDFLGGALFPIDILPVVIQKLLYLTPFPYLFFVPLQVYLGKVQMFGVVQYVFYIFIWILILCFIVRKVWGAGLKVYGAEGR